MSYSCVFKYSFQSVSIYCDHWSKGLQGSGHFREEFQGHNSKETLGHGSGAAGCFSAWVGGRPASMNPDVFERLSDLRIFAADKFEFQDLIVTHHHISSHRISVVFFASGCCNLSDFPHYFPPLQDLKEQKPSRRSWLQTFEALWLLKHFWLISSGLPSIYSSICSYL